MSEQRLCSACLAAKPPRETPASHIDLQGRRTYCCDHAYPDEPALVPGHQCGDDDSTSDRRPALLASVGVAVLPWLLLTIWLVRP